MDNAEFEQDRSIEPDQLDVEALQQAEIFFKWAQRAVFAKNEADRQEAAVEALWGKLYRSARNNPTDFGITSNVTETAVKAAVDSSDQYLQAVNKLLTAKAESDQLKFAVEALEQKKRMLEILVTLHGQQYFATPSIPHNIMDLWEARKANKKNVQDVTDRQRDGVRKRVRREA